MTSEAARDQGWGQEVHDLEPKPEDPDAKVESIRAQLAEPEEIAPPDVVAETLAEARRKIREARGQQSSRRLSGDGIQEPW